MSDARWSRVPRGGRWISGLPLGILLSASLQHSQILSPTARGMLLEKEHLVSGVVLDSTGT